MCMKAPVTKYEHVKSIFEEEMGCKIEDVFSEFEQEPLASASLGQVHEAKLRSTGETVAVKVQHKWIREQVPGDLRMIQICSDAAAYFFPEFKYGWLAEEFQDKLPRELDYKIEADNCNRCKRIFKDNPNVAVPKVYEQFTKTRILVMSFETGTPVTHVRKIHEQGIDLKDLSKLIS